VSQSERKIRPSYLHRLIRDEKKQRDPALKTDFQCALHFFPACDASKPVARKCPTLRVLSLTVRLHELQSKVLVPQLLVLSARFKLVSAIKVL
jgi:hypothetical protein